MSLDKYYYPMNNGSLFGKCTPGAYLQYIQLNPAISNSKIVRDAFGGSWWSSDSHKPIVKYW